MTVKVHPADLYIGDGNTVTIWHDEAEHDYHVSGQTAEMVEVITRTVEDGPRSYRLFPKQSVLKVNGDQVYCSPLVPRYAEPITDSTCASCHPEGEIVVGDSTHCFCGERVTA